MDPCRCCVEHHHVHPLRHGYTNHTSGDGTVVVKTYQGPDASARFAREREMLHRMRGRMPVPEIYAALPGELTMKFLPGAHGQDLIEQGHIRPVLRACGELLSVLHAMPVGDLNRARAVPGAGGGTGWLWSAMPAVSCPACHAQL